MNSEFIEAINELERGRKINADILFEAIEFALISAYKKNYGETSANVVVNMDRTTGEFRVFARKEVVDEVTDPEIEIDIDAAQRYKKGAKAGDVVEIEGTPRDFGRIAAQTAKQVVVQRIREAERGNIYEEFSEKENDIVNGIVERQERGTVFVALPNTEAVLPQNEQVPGEVYKHAQRIRAYVLEVRKTNRGPQVVLSRAHYGLVKKLFEKEVPEISSGVVEIKSIAREAGSRTKIAVWSSDENVDPVGACVGPKGDRVNKIVDEIFGEKIDIIKYSEDVTEFVKAALSPASVVSVEIDEEAKIAKVLVPDHQLSLAIGKEGQNARLAAKLTNWKIDIKSESAGVEGR